MRISAYVEYLSELFEDGVVITHVGAADINKDKYPELFYVSKEDGESYMHFAYYEDECVEEYEMDEDYLGTSPKSISIIRRRRVNSNEHCWVIQAQSKNEDKWNQRLLYTFQRTDMGLEGELKFQRLWKGSKKEFYVEGYPTIRTQYNRELKKFNNTWFEANMDENIKSRGIVRKVGSTKNWYSVRSAYAKAVNTWNKR